MVSIGDFVEIRTEPYETWGLGKLMDLSGGEATVRYFDSPGGQGHETIKCPATQVRVMLLPAQTRVYRRHAAGGRWQAGRALHAEGHSVLVQFPNGDALDCRVEELETRWSRPLRDPMPFLVAQATETPFISESRAGFVRAVSAQHASSNGMTALFGASVELVDYQFDVVRRVLTDPVQRFLLADEVGLGKTIEAGVIIRQCVLDDPHAIVVVVTPAALVSQWRQELVRRFAMKSLLDDFVFVVAHDDTGRLVSLLSQAEMLVVDEAHHLSREVEGQSSDLYRLLQNHAPRVPRLLLLSATPVLSDSAGFLRVMHLLDPVVFPLNDLAGFRRRLESRQLIAELVATLVPDNLYSLPEELDRLAAAFGDDTLLMTRIAELREVLDTFPEEDDEGFLASLEALRTHLSETYRLHRRVLRNRRAAVPWATMHRKGLERVNFDGHRTAALCDAIEQLRLRVFGDADVPHAARRAMLGWAVQPLAHVRVADLMQGLGIADGGSLRLASQIDDAAAAVREDSARIDALTSVLRGLLERPSAQVVVFCDAEADADHVFEALQPVFDARIVRHTVAIDPLDEDDDEADDLPPAWQAFMSDPAACRILVCDARAEEGVNLHGGEKVAVHFDLPLSANRIEQRLGRLDRFGNGKEVRSVVLVDQGNPNEVGWFELLSSGWGVFERSVASLQYLIEEKTHALIDEWAAHGASAFASSCEEIAGPTGLVAKELRRINQQDALDALSGADPDAMNPMDECDGDWRTWRAAFRALALDALRFVWRTEITRNNGDEIFRIGYAYKGQQNTLLPVGRFLNTFLEAVDVEAPASTAQFPLTYRYVFQRSSAKSADCLAKETRLLRVGDPMVSALENFCHLDDRGRAFGLWRVRSQHAVNDPSGADLYFRFDFVVEPETPSTTEGPATRQIRAQALARQAGASLPPLYFTVWTSGAGEILESPPAVVLEDYKAGQGRPATGPDFNLNPERWRALQHTGRLTWLQEWDLLCKHARTKAERSVRQSDRMREHVERAVNSTQRQLLLRTTQGQARIARLEGEQAIHEKQDLADDEGFYRSLEKVLRQPLLRLDSVGAVFVSQDSPFQR
ncbi:protein DpdE [Variovorax sp. YR566]|uniref:protein DpdE n=1 Tax=Variovorax sp. YR566 TaxID=3450237 RepID=UPI003F7DEDB4